MNGNDFNDYADGWAQMMLTIWEEKMSALNIEDTGALKNSLRTEVVRQSGGDVTRINHFFLYYGHYASRGVGNGYKKGNGGDLGFTPKREKRPWIYGKYWYSKNKLLAEMIRTIGNDYFESISEILSDKP